MKSLTFLVFFLFGMFILIAQERKDIVGTWTILNFDVDVVQKGGNKNDNVLAAVKLIVAAASEYLKNSEYIFEDNGKAFFYSSTTAISGSDFDIHDGSWTFDDDKKIITMINNETEKMVWEFHVSFDNEHIIFYDKKETDNMQITMTIIISKDK
jgi:hypothetical protein